MSVQAGPANASAAGRPTDVIGLLARACARDLDVPAICFEDGIQLSRQGLAERVERFAGYLAERVAPGEPVALMAANRTEFMIAWLACLACGATLVTLNPTAGSHDAAHVLRDSSAALAIVDATGAGRLRAIARDCPRLRGVVEIAGPEPAGLDGFRGRRDLSLTAGATDPEAIANVFYTSGSTGPPKGCMIDHRYWLRFVDVYLQIYGMRADDRLLTCLHFFYNDACWQLLAALRSGTTFVAMRRFSVTRFWEVVRSFEITQLFGIASIPSLLMSAPPGAGDRDHRVRFAVQVGIPSPRLHPRLVDRWGFPWLELYGSTETGIVAAVPPSEADDAVGSGTVGRPAPGVDVRLIEPGSSSAAREVSPGEPGELLVRAPGMMSGYLNMPEATRASRMDGWLRTGDLLRADPRGRLFFVGRLKDLIRRSGENVAAAEVEAVLKQHPMVVDAAVTPVADELRGEEIKAHVLLGAEQRPDGLAPEQLVEHCARLLAPHKVPRFIAYRSEDFPRTPSMRVAKQQLLADDVDPRRGAWDREAGKR